MVDDPHRARARARRIAAAIDEILVEQGPRHSTGDHPFRGADTTPPLRHGVRGLQCPACNGPLGVEYERGIEIHRCAACSGLWLDPGELDELTDSIPPVDDPDMASLREQMKQVVVPQEVRYRKCPRCHTVMNRRNYGTHSGVIIDECREHGVFLDPGEFEAIETFVRLGGLELERQRKDFREQEVEHARIASDAAASHGVEFGGSRQRRRLWALLNFLFSATSM